MADNPLISVIVPFYNEDKYLADCLESIKNQTYKNIEIVLINDGSIDNSEEICKKFVETDCRFKLFNKDNGGIADARNYGISHAQGMYFAFVDSDDEVSVDYIEYLYNLLMKYNVKLSISALSINHNNKFIVYKGQKREIKFSQKEALKSILLDDAVDLSPCCKLYERKIFDNIKYPSGKLFEDTATTYKTILLYDFVAYGGESKYTYKVRNNSITTCTNFISKMDLIYNTEDMCNTIVKKYPDLYEAAERRKVWAYFSTLNQLIRCEKVYEYRNYYKLIKNYLRSKRKIILRGKEYSKRDKIASICFMFGFRFYKFSWSIYQKLTAKI